jgi:hypothetical protein
MKKYDPLSFSPHLPPLVRTVFPYSFPLLRTLSRPCKPTPFTITIFNPWSPYPIHHDGPSDANKSNHSSSLAEFRKENSSNDNIVIVAATVISFYFLMFLVGSKKTLGSATTPVSNSKGDEKGSRTSTTITWLISLEEIS